MVININPSDRNIMNSSSSLGTINFPESNEIYDINYILNNNITATSKTSSIKSLFIKFNVLQDNDANEINKLLPFNIFSSNSNFSCIVSIFNGNDLSTKYISFKIYEIEGKNTIDSDVYRVIKSNDIYINAPPPNYDYETYSYIINSYKFPPSTDNNYIKLSLRPVLTNDDQQIYNFIDTYYNGQLNFSIQREFMSPTGNTITTKESPMYTVIGISTNSSGVKQIPNIISVQSFSYDKSYNNLTSFFKPSSTILYFYKLNSIVTNYIYTDPSPVIINNPVTELNLDLKNNANLMYKNKIQTNNLNSVTRRNTYNLAPILCGTSSSDLNNSTQFNITYTAANYYTLPVENNVSSSNYQSLKNTDSFGHDIIYYKDMSLEDCKKNCDQNINCGGIGYDNRPGHDYKCYIKDRLMYPKGEKQPLDGYDIYWKSQ